MSILSGFKKYKKYKKTNEGYQLQSQWTSSQTVEMNDGNTAETNLGAIKGITSSLASTSNNYALSASAGKNLQDQVTTLNTDLTSLAQNTQSLQGWTPFSFNANIEFGSNGVTYIGKDITQLALIANAIGADRVVTIAITSHPVGGKIELHGYNGNLATPLVGPAWIIVAGLVKYQ